MQKLICAGWLAAWHDHQLGVAQGVGRELEWRAVLGERLLRDASDGGSAALGRLVDIFVERHHQLWKVRGLSRTCSTPST